MKNATKSKVMTIANRLVAQGYNRPHAMVKAWALVKLPKLETKVAGVTYGNRQLALEHLAMYTPESITIAWNGSATTRMIATPCPCGPPWRARERITWATCPAALAAFIAPLLDAGKAVEALFREVRGGYQPWQNYGLLLEVIA